MPLVCKEEAGTSTAVPVNTYRVWQSVYILRGAGTALVYPEALPNLALTISRNKFYPLCSHT